MKQEMNTGTGKDSNPFQEQMMLLCNVLLLHVRVEQNTGSQKVEKQRDVSIIDPFLEI